VIETLSDHLASKHPSPARGPGVPEETDLR
jgi:hypothetical protein